MYKDARKAAGLSIEEAAFGVHIAPRTLCKYEAEEVVPQPGVILGMAKLYNRPEMTQLYCRETCPIGQTYSYDVLNGVSTDLAHVLLKISEEVEEARLALSQVARIVINKKTRNDFTDQEWMDFQNAVMEFIDVEHTVEVLKLALGRMVDVQGLVAEHNRKCVSKGYVRKEKGHLVAAR